MVRLLWASGEDSNATTGGEGEAKARDKSESRFDAIALSVSLSLSFYAVVADAFEKRIEKGSFDRVRSGHC